MKVNFTDKDMLKAALIACGLPASVIDVGNPQVPYFEYTGRNAGQCHVKVQREHLGSGCNDIAFELNPEGESVMRLCDYARRRVGNDFAEKVTREYAIAATMQHYTNEGREVHRQDASDGRVHLYVRA
jgi:translation elongation factor EF-G